MYRYKVITKQTIFGKVEMEFDFIWQAMEYIKICLDNGLRIEIEKINA